MIIDHTPNIKYPACLSSRNNYFHKNKLVAKNILDIEKIIASNKLHRKKYTTFKYIGKEKSCLNLDLSEYIKKDKNIKYEQINIFDL